MAHRPIAVESVGAGGSAEDAGGVEPGPSIDHGGEGVFIEQVVVPTVPRPSARDKDAARDTT